jgi:hypothetical protein
MNPADAESTKIRNEINQKVDKEIATVNVSNEELGSRLALAEVLIDQLTERLQDPVTEKPMQVDQSKLEETMMAKIKEVQCQVDKIERDHDKIEIMQDKIHRLEVQNIQFEAEGKALQKRVKSLEEMLQERTSSDRDRDDLRMATPDPRMATPDQRRYNEADDKRYNTPQSTTRCNDERETPETINPRARPNDNRDSDRDNQRMANNNRDRDRDNPRMATQDPRTTTPEQQ